MGDREIGGLGVYLFPCLLVYLSPFRQNSCLRRANQCAGGADAKRGRSRRMVRRLTPSAAAS